MRVLIRTDASEAIGIGHLIRCLTLASAIQNDGASVTFACAELPPAAERMIREKGFELVKLNAPSYAKRTRNEEILPSLAQERDAQATIAATPSTNYDWVVVDHYGLAADWELRMRDTGRWLLAIDDLSNRPHRCDVLLDQNLHRGDGAGYDQYVPLACERLIGPRYALLDSAFAVEKTKLDESKRDGVLISFGGSDPKSMTLPVLQALLDLSHDALRVDVVAGALNCNVEAIKKFVAGVSNVWFHHATHDMARLMARARLYVGAGGIASWERCCLGLPGVVVAVTENQESQCRVLDDIGSHVYLGNASSVTPQGVAQAAMAVLASPAWIARLADRSSAIVDGLGAVRVSARLTAGEVRVREATRQDSEKILYWRNHPIIRKYSGNSAEISIDNHHNWFEKVLSDPNCHLLIGEDGQGALGVLRYDILPKAARVSIYVVPNRLGNGIGAKLLAAGERWVIARCPEVVAISAIVHPENGASIRMFENAGYRKAELLFSKNLIGRKIE
ncbi:MAG: UDP-2,4-diacetamido-2,4,6-trideoxy-beta-L-altropyranose hydrolase [Betaproteobacteria bacterium]|nr:UDP-2,4-diacetamido-2,4,6-trideoxy-beta-L-altropyranose hydrolase [Betaproteobacteria bacterium]